MACERYKQIEREWESARSRYAQFTYKENRHLRGVSDTRAKQIATEEKNKMTELSEQMSIHQTYCEECKKG